VKALRAAVVGVGAFGRHHARILGGMGDEGVRLVGLVDPDPTQARPLAERLGVPWVTRVEDLPEPPDLASVAVPTALHRRVAEPLLKRGVHCLVEKPLAGSSGDAQALVAAAERGGAVLMVGLVERFNPVLAAAERLGGRPLFLEVHRLAPPSPRSADIGVVMDLMIHDLDLLHHLVGEEALSVDAVGVPVIGPHEDIANARITFPSGCVANLTASRVSLQRLRRTRIFTREAYLSLDSDRREALLVRRREGGSPAPGAPAVDLSGSPFETERLAVGEAEPLAAEIAALVEAVRGSRPPPVGGDDAIRALRLAERVLADLRAHGVPSEGAGLALRS
jgi:predicted dehydrogenase